MTPPTVHAYDYVNSTYDSVRDVLKLDAVGIFQRATTSATARAKALTSTIRVKLGPVEVGADVIVRVTSIEERALEGIGPAMHVHLTWEAAPRADLFPVMTATLTVFALSPTETQLDFHGTYVPPLGPLGAVFDKAIGHRIAEAAARRFLEDTAERLRTDVRASHGSP